MLILYIAATSSFKAAPQSVWLRSSVAKQHYKKINFFAFTAYAATQVTLIAATPGKTYTKI